MVRLPCRFYWWWGRQTSCAFPRLTLDLRRAGRAAQSLLVPLHHILGRACHRLAVVEGGALVLADRLLDKPLHAGPADIDALRRAGQADLEEPGFWRRQRHGYNLGRLGGLVSIAD